MLVDGSVVSSNKSVSLMSLLCK